MEILFTLLSERYERKTVMISTNLVFSEWTRIFKSPMTTMAAIDRVVHHCVIVDMMAVESYRAKEATITSRQATTIQPDAEAPRNANEQETSPVTSENGTR
jgi:IstB-like ATP binding protein